jgi:hypothetical protein
MGEILDAAFQLLRVHYSAVVLASGVFLLPPVLLNLLAPSFAPVTNILDRLLSLAASAVVAVVVSDIYLGEEVDLGRSIRAVGRRFGSVWGAALIQGLVIVVGLLLLIVPGIIFAAWSFAMPAIVMIEGASAGESWDRSKSLAKGYVWHILATLGVAWLMVVAAFMGVVFIAGFGIGMLGVGEAIVEPISAIALLLLYPFVGVVGTLLYYDLRIRKEGFDLEILARSMGEAAPLSLVKQR